MCIRDRFSSGSDVLILDQPTRGVDIGAISFIHSKILSMREAGKGILLISADLNELLSLSDRILVMHKGNIVAELDNRKKEVTEKELGLYICLLYTSPDTEGVYSWWSYRFKAREKNAGWRIDYFCVSECLKERLVSASIHTEVMGSDHCPVELVIS